MTIAKIQRPLATNDPDSPWLLYTEDSSVMIFVPDREVPEEVRKIVGQRPKAYFEIQVREDKIEILGPVRDQPW